MSLLMLVGSLLTVIVSCSDKGKSKNSQSPEEGLATFKVPEGFKIELVAAEPLITSPVDMMIDENGLMYVVVMPGYPLDKSRSGKIVLLNDTDADGKMDKQTVFAEGLMLPDGIMRWKKGIIVTDAPDIFYLADTTGDGKADIKEVMLTGFALTNPQHNLNDPQYALDNWIYVAHQGSVKTQEYAKEFGDEGTEIYIPGNANSTRLPKNASGRCIRFRPDKSQLELTSSDSQFGQTFDQWGHWFGCNNSNQGYHEVIANRYFERNANLQISEASQSMSDHLKAPEVFPTTINPDRQLLTDVGVMTSGCGLTAYMADAFPAPFNQNITFIAEPVSNLVHVDVLRDSGASFVAGRIYPNKEFLTSTDAWSRPVNMYVGPDGALYVLDYYRRVIESPEWMSAEVIAEGGLYDGSDKGRIYRISPVNAEKAEWMKGLQLGASGSDELINNLANSNIWWRLNAQRLLVDRADLAAVPTLAKMATNPSAAMGRLHALWTLEGMGILTPELIANALKDTIAGIRENAVRLAELHLTSSPGLEKSLLALQNDPDAKVRFQLLLTLGFVDSHQSAKVRNQILFHDINDKWVQIAALSAPASQTASLLKVVLEKSQDHVPEYASLVQRLTNMVGASAASRDIHQLIQKATTLQIKEQSWQAPILEGLALGMKKRKVPVKIAETDQRLLIKTFFDNPSAALRQSSLQLLAVSGISNEAVKTASITRAVNITSDTSQTDEKRAEAINFLALGDPSLHVSRLEQLLVPQEQSIVQLAALRTLGRVPTNKVSEYLIAQWPALTTEIRQAAIGILMANPERVPLLIDALEKGKILTSNVGFGRSVSLMQSKDPDLRKRARLLFTKGEREAKEINKSYQASLEIVGDPIKGKQQFSRNCATCHQVRGELGLSFGPDLGTIHNWK
ncbi:MAG: PVC-type heme-binding CxxCH protein, partial [Chitinophagaceae bacterium]